MPLAHVHDVMGMINSSGKAYTEAELQAAIIEHFGADTQFSSCSLEGMDAAKAVDFLISRGKFVPEQAGTCCGACGG